MAGSNLLGVSRDKRTDTNVDLPREMEGWGNVWIVCVRLVDVEISVGLVSGAQRTQIRGRRCRRERRRDG